MAYDRALSEKFKRFAERECPGSSPLYEALAQRIVSDEELLGLASHARVGQPPSNMLLGAVHYLLLFHYGDDPLARFYPDLTPSPEPASEAFPEFRRFCFQHRRAILRILGYRAVSTNEVQRCACLMPAFAYTATIAGASLLHLVEVGTSAGLNLGWDRYAYRYDAGNRVGPNATLTLSCALRGERRPPAPGHLPSVGSRIGIDPEPLDVHDAEDMAWLRALIWPEHHERVMGLEKAVAIARGLDLQIVEGEGNALLSGILSELPREGLACVYHSFTLNQFSVAARETFHAILRDFSHTRPVARIGMEWVGNPIPVLDIEIYRNGAGERSVLARCDGHGRWIEWLAA